MESSSCSDQKPKHQKRSALMTGVAPEIFGQGADFSNEGAKIRFSGYHECQKSPKSRLSSSDGG